MGRQVQQRGAEMQTDIIEVIYGYIDVKEGERWVDRYNRGKQMAKQIKRGGQMGRQAQQRGTERQIDRKERGREGEYWSQRKERIYTDRQIDQHTDGQAYIAIDRQISGSIHRSFP